MNNCASNNPRNLIAADDLTAFRETIAGALDDICDSNAVHSYIDGKSTLDHVVWDAAKELGWLAIGLPEAYGGLGMGPQGLDVLHRELGRHCAPGGFISTLSAAQWLAEVGSIEQKETYLKQVVDNGIGFAVPATRSASPLERRDGKVYGQIPILGTRTASYAIVPIVGDGAATWVIISAQDSGCDFATLDIWDRTRELGALTCNGARIESTLPRAADTDASLWRLLALAIASDSIGGAERITYQTIDYLKTRVQFGRPIGALQALKHRVADIVTHLTVNASLVDHAIEAASLGDADADMFAALAKAGAGDAYVFIAGDCVQLHGGIGHTWEYDVHIHVKRARLNAALGSDSAACRDMAAAALAKSVASGATPTEYRS